MVPRPLFHTEVCLFYPDMPPSIGNQSEFGCDRKVNGRISTFKSNSLDSGPKGFISVT
jgi:hypothetical protein